MPTRLSSRHAIIAGFAGVAVFMVGMLAIGLTRLGEANVQMDELANRTFRRAEAVYTMRMVARDRLVGLQSMFFLSDPFERDAERMRYSAEAARFIEAREALLSLGPSSAQHAMWEQARSLIVLDEDLHRQALELIFAEQPADASLLIRQQIIPIETRLLDRMNAMLDLERAETQQKLSEANLRYRGTFMLMVLLTLGTLAVTVATAVYVTRRSARNEHLILQEKRRAEEAAEKLTWAASHDALTGLHNRRVFEGKLDALLRTAREESASHVLAYIDLDRFKQVNDRCGHEAGNQLLVAVARLMHERVRAGDTLARLGGDEFGLLLPYCSVSEAAALVAELQRGVEAFSLAWGTHSLAVGLSAGVVPVDPGAGDAAELVRRADVACYASKAVGRAPGVFPVVD